MVHTAVRARRVPVVAWCRPSRVVWSQSLSLSLCQSGRQESGQATDSVKCLGVIDDQRGQINFPTDSLEQALLEMGRKVQIIERVHPRALRQQLGALGDLE